MCTQDTKITGDTPVIESELKWKFWLEIRNSKVPTSYDAIFNFFNLYSTYFSEIHAHTFHEREYKIK